MEDGEREGDQRTHGVRLLLNQTYQCNFKLVYGCTSTSSENKRFHGCQYVRWICVNVPEREDLREQMRDEQKCESNLHPLAHWLEECNNLVVLRKTRNPG